MKSLTTRLDRLETVATARHVAQVKADSQEFIDWLRANTTPEAKDAYWRIHCAICLAIVESDPDMSLNFDPDVSRDQWLEATRALMENCGGAVRPGDVDIARSIAERAPGEWRIMMVNTCEAMLYEQQHAPQPATAEGTAL
jgi:hypothetical protein